jgi:hypothetical protein
LSLRSKSGKSIFSEYNSLLSPMNILLYYFYVFVFIHSYKMCLMLKIKHSGFWNQTIHKYLFILPITVKFKLNLFYPTDRKISQEKSRRILEKLFLELDPIGIVLSLKTAYKQFISEVFHNSI